MKCYEIKKCPFYGSNYEDAECPAYQIKVGCWEYDWISFYQKMPKGKVKIAWRDVMLNNCPQCVVYPLHQKQIDNILEGLRK